MLLFLSSNQRHTRFNVLTPGFAVVGRDRGSRGGGVLLLVRNCVSFQSVEVPKSFDRIELVCVDISWGYKVWRIEGLLPEWRL